MPAATYKLVMPAMKRPVHVDQWLQGGHVGFQGSFLARFEAQLSSLVLSPSFRPFMLFHDMEYIYIL